MKIMIKPYQKNFIVKTTDVKLIASERAPLSVFLDVEYKKHIYSTEISFDNVAKVEFTQLNFWESNYNNYQIDADDGHTYQYGIYLVINSRWDDIIKMFDPKNRLDLKHILIVGNDSYIEILAQSRICEDANDATTNYYEQEDTLQLHMLLSKNFGSESRIISKSESSAGSD